MIGSPADLGRTAARRFGPAGGAVLLGAASLPLLLGVGLVLGRLAKALQVPVDTPFFAWIQGLAHAERLERQLLKVGLLADIPMVQVLAVLGAAVLGVAYGRRWCLPVVVVGFAYATERLVQQLLAAWIDRGHPVGTTGTFFSGGVARTLAVYGALLACSLVLVPEVGVRRRRLLWAGLFGLAVTVGVSRVWLGEHWLTDVLAAYPLGLLLLGAEVAMLAALTRPPRTARMAT